MKILVQSKLLVFNLGRLEESADLSLAFAFLLLLISSGLFVVLCEKLSVVLFGELLERYEEIAKDNFEAR